MMLLEGNQVRNFKSYSHKSVFHIIFDHAKRPYNFLDAETLDNLDTLITKVEKGDYRGVVFSSSKSSFVVGADVKAISQAHDADKKDVRAFLEKGQELFNRIEDLKIPTVAILSGVTMGGGLELALACTSRILIENPADDEEYTVLPKTRIALPEVKLGILPSWGGTTRLPRIINPIKAMELICSGRDVGATEALKLGLITCIQPHHKAIDAAHVIIDGIDCESIRDYKCVPPNVSRFKMAIAGRLTKWFIGRKQKKMFGIKDKYPSPYIALRVFKDCLKMNRREALMIEVDAFCDLVQTDECRELVGRFLGGEKG